jgi:hypothetical protein
LTKAAVRTLVGLFAGFFGTLQLSMTGCQLAPGAPWTRWLCDSHRLASSLMSIAFLFALTLMALSRRSAAFRRPIAVLLLLAYGLYGLDDAFESQLWWLAVLPAVALAAALGIALRARWGTLVTYAISALFVIYWSWGIITAARVGIFQSRPPLEAALMLVPGIAFGLLAGFCCYASRLPTRQDDPSS